MLDAMHRPTNRVYENVDGAILTGEPGSYISGGHSDALALESGSISFAFTAANTTGRQTLVSKNGSGRDEGGHFTLSLDGPELLLSMETADKTKMFRVPNVQIEADEEYHIVMSFGEDGLAVWLDGQIVAADPDFTQGIEMNSREMIFGGSNADYGPDKEGAKALFEGEIAEIAVFDSQLTEHQIHSEALSIVEDKAREAMMHEAMTDLVPAFLQAHHGSDTLKELMSDYGYNHHGMRDNPYDDMQMGTSDDDVMAGGKSDDAIFGGAGDDNIKGGKGDDGLHGGLGDDVLKGNAGNDVLQGGYGNDTLKGGAGNDVLDGGHGEDVLRGGAGNDLLIARSDGREGYITDIPGRDEGDPYNELTDGKLYPDQPIPADDVLEGGAGADTFYFQLLINGKERYIREHTKADGTINWHGVAGENDKLHDHWVDVIGNDVILDYSKEEGDKIVIEGHTTEIYEITYGDSNGDGVLDHSIIHLYSDQGANGGAHQYDKLGTITVYGDLVQEGDIEQNAAPAYGIVDNIKDVDEAVTPITNGEERSSSTPKPKLDAPNTETPGGQNAVFFVPGTMEFDRGAAQEVNLGSPDSIALDSATIAFGFNIETLKWGSTLVSKGSKDKAEGEFSVRVDQFGTFTITIDDGTGAHVIKIPNAVQAGVDYDFAMSFGDEGVQVLLNGVVMATLPDVTVGLATNGEDLLLGAGAWASTPGTSDKVYGYLDGSIKDFGVYEGQLSSEDLYGDEAHDSILSLDGAPEDYVISIADDGTLEVFLDGTEVEIEDTVEFLQFGSETFNIGQIRVGTDGDDTIHGYDAGDLIVGGMGDDRLVGNEGDDHLSGGNGNDTLIGGDGADTLNGGNGNDKLYGYADDDVIVGGAGNDEMMGGLGADVFEGGEGDDIIFANHRGDAGADAEDSVVYLGDFDDYEISVMSVYNGTRGEYMTQVIVKDADDGGADGVNEGTDKLMDIDLLVFADQTVSVDDLWA